MKRHPLFWYFTLTFAITWVLAALYFLFSGLFVRISGQMSAANPLFILAVWAPNLAALVVTVASGGKAAAVRLLKRFIPRRLNPLWYILALLLMPACGLMINTLSRTPMKLLQLPAAELRPLLLLLLVTGPLGEELGWRGFALPRLLRRHSAAVSGLILGAVWGIWHLPSFFVSGLPQAGAPIAVFLAGALSFSLIITWVMDRTGGCVFLSFLLHYSVNFTLSAVGTPLLYVAAVQVAAALLLLALYGRELLRPPDEISAP